MSNKRIIELTTESSVTNDMVVAVDDPAFAETKKATIEEITEIERTAREAQDDVIEASVGLNADGTFTPPVVANYIDSAGYLAAGYSETLLNGLRLLDNQVWINAVAIQQVIVTVERTLTVAEINQLNSTPITLVDVSIWTPTTLIDVMGCVGYIEFQSSAWDVASQEMEVYYDDGASGLPILEFTNAFVEEASGDKYQKCIPTDQAEIKVGCDVNVRLPSADPVGVGDSEITLFLSYKIITIS